MESIKEAFSSLAQALGIGPMDLLTVLMTTYALVQVVRSWGKWKGLSTIKKNNVILPVLAAILFILASITIRTQH